MTIEEKAIKKALSLGADEAEAFVERKKSIRVDFASDIHNIKQSQSIGLGLRVAVGKKLAINTTTILEDSDINRLAEKAVKIAKGSPKDPNWETFNRKFGKSSVEGTYDKSLENLSYDKIVDSLTGAIDHASENNRDVQVTRGLLQITIDETTITNNYQDKVTRKGTKINWYLMTKPTKGGTGTGSESQQVRSWKELDFEKIPELAAEKAITYQNAKPIKSTKLPVIFVNKFNAQMLGLMLGPNINSEWILKGRSTFRDKLNKQIAHENFSIQDSALLAAGYESRPFDDEGHPTQKTSIIKDGKLKNFIYDTYYAKRAETKSTGNAFRNYDSIPSPSTNNLILSNGSQEIDEIIAETKKGLYVEKTIGHWLSKPTSGELSATVTHGLLIEDGEFTDPIGNVVISGNFFDILQNKIAAIGKDKKNSGKYYSPSIKISEMSIAGK